VNRQGPPRHVAPERLFRLLLRSPRAALPIALPIAGALAGAFRVCAIHPLDEAEAIERHATAPEPVRLHLVAAELTALALHEGDARVFADGAELSRMLREREATALIRAAIEALDVISPSFRRIDLDAWEARLAKGALAGANAHQARLLDACVENGEPRLDRYFGLPLGQLTDGQWLAFYAARRTLDEQGR
jgi:hypothetical protein